MNLESTDREKSVLYSTRPTSVVPIGSMPSVVPIGSMPSTCDDQWRRFIVIENLEKIKHNFVTTTYCVTFIIYIAILI